MELNDYPFDSFTDLSGQTTSFCLEVEFRLRKLLLLRGASQQSSVPVHFFPMILRSCRIPDFQYMAASQLLGSDH